MTNLDSILKSRDITFPTNVHLVKATVFPVVMYGCESCTIKKAAAKSLQSCPTLYDPINCSTPGFPVHHQLPELAQTHVHRVGDAIQSSHPLSSPYLLPIPPSIRVFSNESTLRMRWPKYWSFSISPSNEYSGLISFRIDWFELFAVQGTLKSLLQHHSSKASILQHTGQKHQFFFCKSGIIP